MQEDNWEEIYNELYDLREEFIQKWRKNINDLRYQTKVNENNKRVSEIINSFVRIVKRHDVLYQVVLENEYVNYEDNKAYMESTGLWEESVFNSYSFKVIYKLEKILK
ncbi:hypothetical protein [Flavobacterium sp.]|uniref:hypothetical protein n=1 Tax=Flavobacterium sp. TaxID=239 RepID=UPI004047EC4B